MFMCVGWPAGPSCPDRQLLPPLSPRALCTSVIWVCRSQEEPPLDPLPGQFRPLFRLSLNIPPFTSGCHRTPSSAAVISRVRGHTQRPFGVQEDLRTLYIYFFLKKERKKLPLSKIQHASWQRSMCIQCIEIYWVARVKLPLLGQLLSDGHSSVRWFNRTLHGERVFAKFLLVGIKIWGLCSQISAVVPSYSSPEPVSPEGGELSL